jgi:diadenosine tetraphosphatase ApaH/serine/threonine PP2A family protein phosphatase
MGCVATLSDIHGIINVGSVGLPRGGDKRATWATYDAGKGEVALHRTAYDVQEVIRTIKHLRDLGREI